MRRYVLFTMLLLAGCASGSTGERKPLMSGISSPFGKAANPSQPAQAPEDVQVASGQKPEESDTEYTIRHQNEARDVYQDAGYPH